LRSDIQTTFGNEIAHKKIGRERLEPCAGRVSADDQPWASPPPIFAGWRAADATLVSLIVLLHFHVLHDLAVKCCLGAKLK